ncbi:MAG: hypothetical protein PHE33_02140 [Bacteroidales bacterium]|nr:hypothetical protein [Bacteroidales bacterium]
MKTIFIQEKDLSQSCKTYTEECGETQRKSKEIGTAKDTRKRKTQWTQGKGTTKERRKQNTICFLILLDIILLLTIIVQI